LLRAAVELGNAPYEKLDRRALELAGVPPVDTGSWTPEERDRLKRKLGWARSNLKKTGAFDSLGAGVWGVTDEGQRILGMPEEQAATHLGQRIREAYALRQADTELLASWRNSLAHGEPVQLTVRELISHWNVSRRWDSVNRRVATALAEHGLNTDPDFTVGSLDQTVAIIETGAKKLTPTAAAIKIPTLTVGNLSSANAGVIGVTPGDNLLTAQSLMRAHDYSQLSVMSGERELKGAVSWESIARARLRQPDADLRDCMIQPTVVDLGTPLLDSVPQIASAGFVFVRGPDRRITGLVTTADLSEQFASLSRPFLLVGQIEGVLRVAVDATFDADDLYEILDLDDSDREIEAAHSLTIGEIQRIVEEPAGWERLGWRADRKVFTMQFDRVRQIRNEIMHFSPDPVSVADVTTLRHFLDWVQELVTLPAGH
jgi:predicted transcriptional regulator